jgi:UPF0755 protein
MKRIIRTKYYILRFLSKLFIVLLLIPLVYNYIPVQKGKSTFYLPSSDIDTVIHTLQENGYGVSKIDKYMLQFFQTPKKGWYRVTYIPKERFSFFQQLETQKAKTMRVKLYAGETSEELTKRLARDLKLNHKKLLEEYRRQTKYLEGDIFAGYYKVARKADERAVMTALYSMSRERLQHFAQTKCDNPKNPNELEIKVLLILASIIQKETNNKHEMALISSVIENRLNKGMKLQMDGTLNYGKFSHKPVTPKRIRKDRSYYNTYIYGGIPPAPLCTISMAALEAALHPKNTSYLYFMLNKTGRHDFASSYKQHVKNIRAFREKKKKSTDTNITKTS